MNSDSKKVQFTFGWLALKLLGKSLYSNAWSAISELVANGFDAHAQDVFVFLDITNKSSATVEIFDNGSGMSLSEMNTYAQVGYNKREDFRRNNENVPIPQDIMGRKGIGKLAALYLSSNYYIISKKDDEKAMCWQMKYRENHEDSNEKPSLELLDILPAIDCSEEWDKIRHGTLLKLVNVNLSGLGEQAFVALNAKLANYFSLESMGGRKIHLCIKKTQDAKINFDPVVKKIAFKNMAFIECSPNNLAEQNAPINAVRDTIQKIPYTKLDSYYDHAVNVSEMKFSEDFSGEYTGISKEGQSITKRYSLRGWIGIHCTIDSESGQQNDDVFTKNKFYNPIQLRLYVRNKLAVENFLNIINSTQTYVNYIEGEINFDLLDDDDFPDIATSNRQGLDEHDERVFLLINILNPIIRSLIDKRSSLAQKMKENQTSILNKKAANAKQEFSKEVYHELNRFEQLTNDEKIELNTIIANKVQGDLLPKENFLVFFSHSRADKIFADFLYNVLLSQGVKEEEVFYTSRDDNPEKYEDITPLRDAIHKCITNTNNMIFYLIGSKYKTSEFCMFEGGAGWATRGIGEYPVMAIKYEHIPKFLTNGKNEFAVQTGTTITLNRENYLSIVSLINRLIKHVNVGRRIKSEEEVPLIKEEKLPSELYLFKKDETIDLYMNSTVRECWTCFIDNHLEEYIASVAEK